MTLDDYEVVARDSTSLSEARAHDGFTEIRGQCYHCSKSFKTLGILRRHQISFCRQKAKDSHVETERRVPSNRQVVVDGGVIHDKDDDIEPPPTPPQQAPRSDASSSNALYIPAMKIKLQRSLDEVDKFKAELMKTKDKYIQLLEQSLATK